MCQQNSMEYSAAKKTSTTYSIKKALKALFKKQQQKSVKKANSLESLESLDNLRNSQVECQYDEIEENAANEKLSCLSYEEVQADEEEEVFVPVRFARTEAGTFFWTTSLQPIVTVAQADMDLIEPVFCHSGAQYPQLQFQDRWAQA